MTSSLRTASVASTSPETTYIQRQRRRHANDAIGNDVQTTSSLMTSAEMTDISDQ